MCGFSGFLDAGNRFSNMNRRDLLEKMGDAITHRGPNDSGLWEDAKAGIGFVHRRLSILDLSTAGHQPMSSVSKRYIMVFNGEVYNHLELRKKLGKRPYPAQAATQKGEKWPGWHGHSDTETLLACIDAWGFEQALRKTTGMFAIALWDNFERVLYLARDRMGEKPLYYGWQNGVFLFGSELKALKVHSAFDGEIDRNALALLMQHNYIPAPYSIYKGIQKLLPGTLVKVQGDNTSRQVNERPEAYWSLTNVAMAGQASPFSADDSEAVLTLDSLLQDSIRQQMVADVPLGAFLSGGIDSSTIVALMQVQSSRAIRTFTIGFNEKNYNEAKHAKAVADYLKTEHTELYVSPQEAMQVIPRLPMLYDEPFSDSSQIPTFLVSQMTRQHVTVSLSGDAGDELFGGYNRYFWANSIWQKIGHMPLFARKLAAIGISGLSPELLNGLLGSASRYLPSKWCVTHPGDKAHKLAEILDSTTPDEIYRRLISHWKNPSDIVIGAVESSTVFNNSSGNIGLDQFEHRMMFWDAISYLPDDILVKIDRAAMGVSLETRVPMLDHRVVEFSWSLPLSMKIRNGQGKWLLRQVLYKYVPKELIERPKMGFGVPIDGWLRGQLRDWAEELLDEARLEREGFFYTAPIRKMWKEHLSGQRNWQYHLWDILMFQAWLEYWEQ